MATSIGLPLLCSDSSSAKLEELAADISSASNALVELKDAELAKFLDAVAETKQSQDWSAIAQRQQAFAGALATLKQGQEAVRPLPSAMFFVAFLPVIPCPCFVVVAT